MVKKWVTTMRQRVAATVARAWGFSPGLCVSGIVVLLIGGLAIRAYPGRENERRQIAAAFGAANTFYGVPQMNRDGSRFTYVAITKERGCALYLCDAQTKQTQQIAFEEDGIGIWNDDYELRAWPWAPDDSTFVYTLRDKLVICPTQSGRKPIELTVETNSVSQLVWLTPARFVFVESGTNLCYAQQQNNGEWQCQSCGLPSYDEIFNLIAVTTNTVAWLQNGLICRLNLDENPSRASNEHQAETNKTNATRLNLAQLQKIPVVSEAEPDIVAPTDGLVLWLDASTLKQRNQTVVNSLVDLSQSHNNAVENGSSPIFNAPGSPGALNGRGTIHFSSSPTVTESAGLATTGPLGIKGSAPRTIYAVMRRDPDKAMNISTGNSGVQGEYCGICDGPWSVLLPSETLEDNSFPLLIPTWHILSVVCDGSSQSGFVDGVFKGTSYFPMNTPDVDVELGLRIPKREGDWTTAGSDGDFAELLIYNRALSAVEQQQVESYLSTKWFGGRVITAQNPLVWVNPEMKGTTDFSYSKATGQLLIRNEYGAKKTFWLDDSKEGLSQVMQANSASGAQWVSPENFAYIENRGSHNQIVIADTHGTEKSRLIQNGHVRSFGLAPSNDKMLFVGTISNEPASGIWRYDLKTGQLQSEVAYSDHPFKNAESITAFRCYIRRDYPPIIWSVYPPPKVESGEKYPLVISDTVVTDAIHGPMFQSALADCGAFVAIVERPFWGVSIEDWATNVLNVYEIMKRYPNIDQRRVYLFAASAETQYLSELVEKTPGLWRGIIFLNPDQLPDFSKSPRFQPRPRILLSAGSQEGEDKRFRKYQENALRQGALVEYLISPSEAHRFVGKTGKMQRAESVEHFIFDE